jgi:Uma2 family endonuclease
MTTEHQLAETDARLTIEVAQLYPRQREWTEADYLALPDTNRLIELSEGTLIMTPHPTDRHQQIVGALYRALHAFVSAHDLGIVRLASLPVRLWPGQIREPDLLFVAHSHADRIAEQVFGPPDLVVEVTSSHTEVTDRRDKMSEYARACVAEYWIIDPDDQTVEVFVLRQAVYERLGEWCRGEIARSVLLDGFEIAVDALFAP